MPGPSPTLVFLIAAVMAALFYPCLPAVKAADASPPPGPNCDDAINNLVACFNFVTGGATLPSEECCAAFATVQKGQPVCLCQLLSSGNESSGGGSGINVTLALEIPSLCKVAGVDAANCGGLASPASPPNGTIPPASPGAAGAVAPSTESSSSAAPSTGSGPGNAAYSSRSVAATSIWFAIAGLGTVAVSLFELS